MKKLLLSAWITLASVLQLQANNVQVSNVSLSDPNAVQQTSLINYNISWENSWRTSTNEKNYDGVWLFVKYKKANTSDWRHATLSSTGFTAPTGSTIQVGSDGKGAWMYRSADGQGDVNWTGAQLKWNYSVDGLTPEDSVEIKLFAIEMVYIPSGPFYLGCGGTSVNQFQKGNVSPSTPYLVNSNNEIIIENTTGNLYFNTAPNSTNGDHTGILSANFPKGYNAFWLMKYEASNQQMIDFYNHVTSAAATNLGIASMIPTGAHPNYQTDKPFKAFTTSWRALTAYADWTGMRPYSELEYEKACRGVNNFSVPNEYAWGNTNYVSVNSTINANAEDEKVNLPANANCYIVGSSNIGSLSLRNGIFATTTSDRYAAGAGYYGNMEMSGNVNECVVHISNPAGRAFTGVNGDGYLSATGEANVPTWPTNTFGQKSRGGSYTSQANSARVSDRSSALSDNESAFLYIYGIRLARNAE
jgi:formylglycine-generating enzyme required for sulfatase activity